MKRIFFLFASVLPAVMAVSCTEDELTPEEPDVTPEVIAENEMAVTIRGLEEVFSWDKSDKITVIGENGTQVFSILDTYTATTAKFAGEDIVSGKYTVIFSDNGSAVEELEKRSYTGQIQSGNGNADHLDFDIVLYDVDTYKDITLSDTYASEHGGKLLMSNCLKFEIDLPASVFTVSSFGIKSGSPIFHSANGVSSATDTLGLEFAEPVDVGINDNHITVYMLASWQPIEIAETDAIALWVKDADGKPFKAALKPVFDEEESIVITGGNVYDFTVSSDAWEFYDTGEGSKDDPYVISTVEDLQAMSEKLVDGVTRYFTLARDIDMDGVEWAPVVTRANALKSIDFDGGGHKISNLTINGEYEFASFFGVLNGSVRNLTFENPSVTSNIAAASPAAVVAAQAGRIAGDSNTVVEDVHVTGASVSVTQQQASPTGLLIGQGVHVTVSDCSVSGTVTHAGVDAECHTGGFIGRLDYVCSVTGCESDADVTVTESGICRVFGAFIGSIQGESTIEDCTASGTFDALADKARYSGGFIGNIAARSVIRNCTFTGDVKGGEKAFGGLTGCVFTNAAETLIENCTVTGNVEGSASGTYYGGLIGDIMEKVTVRNCKFSGDVTGSKGYIGGAVGGVENTGTGTLIEGCSIEGSIVTGSKGSFSGGIVGGQLATLTVRNCSVGSDMTDAYGSSYLGGIIGCSNAGSASSLIEGCSYSGKMTGSNGSYFGGIAGLIQGQETVIRNSFSSGSIEGANYGVGGIAGILVQNCTVENCFSTMDIAAGHGIGGIVGRADNNANPASETGLGIKVSGCIAWNASLTSSKMPAGINVNKNFSAGAVVGRSNANNIHTDCFRRPDMTFSCLPEGMNTLYDQENSDASVALEFNGYSGTYYCPYNGKAATSEATISSVAESLGWDTSVWDLSADVPTLKY